MADSATVIERVSVYGYDLTYAHGDYVMSAGRVVNVLPSTVVRITTRGGVEGFGETCPLGRTYLPGFGEGARAALRELAPALIGVDAANLAAVDQAMDATLRGHEYAKSAVDVACWDILGRVADQPVAALLGGVLQADVPLYVAVPLGPPDEMAAFVERERCRRDPSLPAQARRHARARSRSRGGRPRGDRARGRAHRRRERWLAPAGRDRRRPAARGLRPPAARAAVPDARGVPGGPPAEHAPVGPRRGDHGPADPGPGGRGRRDGPRQPEGRPRRRADEGAADARCRRRARPDPDDRGSWGGDLVTAAVSHLAAGVPPAQLFAASYMNDWTVEHVAGYQPRSREGRGPVPRARASASRWTPSDSGLRCSSRSAHRRPPDRGRTGVSDGSEPSRTGSPGPRHASMPSRAASSAIRSASTPSAHHQPRAAFRIRPIRTASASDPSMRLNRPSARTVGLSRRRPTRSLATLSTAITTTVVA